jgi:hypothetical protein
MADLIMQYWAGDQLVSNPTSSQPSHTLYTLRAARNQDGRLEVFGINSAGNIFHTWQTSPNATSNTGWNGVWEILYWPGDQLVSLDVVNNADGRLEVFGITSAGNIFHTWQTSPNATSNTGWNGVWEILNPNSGEELVTLRAARNQDGRLEVFAINTPSPTAPAGSNGNIFHTWQTSPNATSNTGWNGAWQILYWPGDQLVNLDVVNNADGRLEVFGITSAGNIFHTWQTSPNATSNTGWNGVWEMLYVPPNPNLANIYGLVSLDVVNNADGRLEVFGINQPDGGAPIRVPSSGNIFHTWQTSPNSGNNGWVSIGPPNAPTDLNLISLTPSSNSPDVTVEVGWTDNSNDEDYFVVKYSGPPNTGSPSAELLRYPNTKTTEFVVEPFIPPATLTLNIVVDAVNSAGETASNTIPVTIPPSPTTETVMVPLYRGQAGPMYFPYGGQYPPPGVNPPGYVTQITVPSPGLVPRVGFVKLGGTTEQCGDPNAVVVIDEGQTITPAQMTAIFGVAEPKFSQTHPIGFVACVDGSNPPSFFQIEVTIVFEKMS